MAERFRVLVSCPRAWDGLNEFADLFEAHGIVVDVPETVDQQLDEADLLPVIGAYDGILAGDDQLSRRVIEAGSRLKVISKWGVGIDAIDLAAAEERGVLVKNTPGMFGEELADYALGFLILIARSQHIVDREVRAGNWSSIRGHSLAGRTLGIVGLGSSGSALARRARVLAMEVVGTDPIVVDMDPAGARVVDFEELLAVADVVSLHLPGQSEGRALIGPTELAVMKRGVWLINTSRGSLIDEEALVDALESGHVGAAALDVFAREPLARDHPLLSHPAVILGSHNGSNTHEAVARTTRAAVTNLVEGLIGAPPG